MPLYLAQAVWGGCACATPSARMTRAVSHMPTFLHGRLGGYARPALRPLFIARMCHALRADDSSGRGCGRVLLERGGVRGDVRLFRGKSAFGGAAAVVGGIRSDFCRDGTGKNKGKNF